MEVSPGQEEELRRRAQPQHEVSAAPSILKLGLGTSPS